jgi:DUF1680 family protein
MLIDTRKSPYAKAYSISHDAIQWKDGFWKERFNVCAGTMVPKIQKIFEDNRDMFHVVENFRVAAGIHEGKHTGTPYGDGDFYKWMEGAVYSAVKTGNKRLEEELDDYIGLIGKAQLADGYISTKQIISEKSGAHDARNRDVNDFEIYNFGHLFTSACTYKRLTGKDNFIKIALKAADYLNKMYTDAAKAGEVKTAVCPSHYMGLVELYRTTGDKKFLETAELCINIRDKVKDGSDDNQDRIPLREHRKIEGHGVRSTYLYAGVADLYLERGEEALLTVLDSCWDNLVNQKIYITGGCGPLYQGASPLGDFRKGKKTHQSFGYEYQLPNITAYNETCATLGNIFWTHRMFAIRPKAHYFDIIERSMLNLALAAVSLEGDKFFYENMLRRTKGLDYKLTWPLERDDQLACYCCPSNLTRVLAQVSEYAYMVSDNSIYTGIYGASETEFNLSNGASFTLVQDTAYPWDGSFVYTCRNIKKNLPFTLKIRVPGWVEKGSLSVNGQKLRELGSSDANTYIDAEIASPADMKIAVSFEMKPRLTIAHPKAEEDINQAAVERGPLVYCVEHPDAELDTLDDLMIDTEGCFELEDFNLKGQKLVALKGLGVVLERDHYDRNALYQTFSVKGKRKVPFSMIPYFAWDNRGFGEMRVWLPLYFGN